jgi:hypothetical protein
MLIPEWRWGKREVLRGREKRGEHFEAFFEELWILKCHVCNSRNRMCFDFS